MLREETWYGWNYVLRVRQLEAEGKPIWKVACGETNACWIISYDEPNPSPMQTEFLPDVELKKSNKVVDMDTAKE